MKGVTWRIQFLQMNDNDETETDKTSVWVAGVKRVWWYKGVQKKLGGSESMLSRRDDPSVESMCGCSRPVHVDGQ